MNTEQTQGQLSPDEAAASLAFATNLSEKMLMPQAPQEPQNSPQDDPGATEKPKAEKLPEKEGKKEFETQVLDQLDALQKEVEALMQGEVKTDKKDDTGKTE